MSCTFHIIPILFLWRVGMLIGVGEGWVEYLVVYGRTCGRGVQGQSLGDLEYLKPIYSYNHGVIRDLKEIAVIFSSSPAMPVRINRQLPAVMAIGVGVAIRLFLPY